MDTRTLSELALRHGTLVRDRIVPDHTSLAGWYRLHTSGLLVRLHPGASRLVSTTPTPMLRIEAALAAAMPGSMAGGLTAAWLWGSPSAARGPIEIIAPPFRHPGRLAGVVHHRPTRQPHPEPFDGWGVRACNALTATFDVAAWHPDRLVPIIRELLALGRYRLADLHHLLATERRSGRPGVSVLQGTLERAEALGLVDGGGGDRPPSPLGAGGATASGPAETRPGTPVPALAG